MDTPKTVGQADKSGSDELREALLAVCGEKGDINARKAGRWLAKYERRVIDGLRFERAGTYQRAALWCVAEVGSGEFSESGESGDRHARKNQKGEDSIFNGSGHTHGTHKTHQEPRDDGAHWAGPAGNPPGTTGDEDREVF